MDKRTVASAHERIDTMEKQLVALQTTVDLQMRDLFNRVKRLEYIYIATSGFIIALLIRMTLVGQVMSDKLPKVSIAVVGVVIAQIGGFIWWTAQQASTIANLEETANVLTVENNATDRTNLIRDVEQNTEKLADLTDILAEFYDDMEESDNELFDEIDVLHEDVGSMASHMMAIVKLQARIAVLEKTVEFTRKDGM